MTDREIVADSVDHYEGQRALCDWDRLDAQGWTVTHRNIPIVFMRKTTKAAYLERNPGASDDNQLGHYFFWEVSVD